MYFRLPEILTPDAEAMLLDIDLLFLVVPSVLFSQVELSKVC